MRPLVSVVTIFLDGERFLEEAIRSVLSQTLDRWELLLVDDGSTDTSTAIARGYAARYPERIRYLEHDGHANRGMSYSRNVGIGASTAPYVAFIDADDVWLPHKLTRQVQLAEDSSADLVYGASWYWYGWTGAWDDRIRDYPTDIGVPPGTLFPPPELFDRLLTGIHTPAPSDFLARRAIVDAVGGFEESFTSHRQLYEDQAFLSKVFLAGTVLASGECWVKYRMHDASCGTLTERSGRHLDARAYFLQWLDRHAATIELPAPMRVRLKEVLDEAVRARQGGGELHSSADEAFEQRCLHWWLRVAAGNRAGLGFPERTSEVAEVTIEHVGTGLSYDVQLNLVGAAVEEGLDYVVTFDVYAGHPRDLAVGCSLGYQPWSGLGLYRGINADSGWSSHTLTFTASASSTNARLHFDLGQEAGVVRVARVFLETATGTRLTWPTAP